MIYPLGFILGFFPTSWLGSVALLPPLVGQIPSNALGGTAGSLATFQDMSASPGSGLCHPCRADFPYCLGNSFSPVWLVPAFPATCGRDARPRQQPALPLGPSQAG